MRALSPPGAVLLAKLAGFVLAAWAGYWVASRALAPAPHELAGKGSPAARLVDATEVAGLAGFRHFGGLRGNYIAEDMGSGVVLGDVDGDGDLDLFLPAINALATFSDPSTPKVSNRLYLNDGAGHFTDHTEEAGLSFEGVGMGGVFGDLDGDGDLDLVVTNFGPDLLYENLGGARFMLVPNALPGSTGFSGGPALGDVDGDGDLDIYVPHYVWFDMRLPPAPPTPETMGSGDLPESVRRILVQEDERFVTPPPYGILPVNFRPEPNHLYRNDGSLRFMDISEQAGVSDPTGRSLQALMLDVDSDGDTDIFVTNDVSYNRLFLNRGDGTFEDASLRTGLLDIRGSMGATVGDLDGDGCLDLLVSNYSTDPNGMFLGDGCRRGQLRFHRVEALAQIAQTSLGRVGWGVELTDLDLDGDQDIYVAQGHIRNLRAAPTRLGPQPDEVLLCVTGAVFEPGAGILVGKGVGRGTASADLDGDGDDDLLILEHGRGVRLLRNESHAPGSSLTVRLRDHRGEPFGVGARILVRRADGSTTTRLLLAGDGYLSHDGYARTFSLPSGEPPEHVEVIWPDGERTSYEGLPARGSVTLERR